MVLFAQHDVMLDPPFTRLDILSCRNLMIYFSAVLQRRLMPLFHYSLRPGGVLLLGGSETVGRAQVAVHARWTRSRGSTGAATMATDAGPVDFPVQRRRSSRNAAQESNCAPADHAPPAICSRSPIRCCCRSSRRRRCW